MERQPLNTDFLRAEGRIVPRGIRLMHDPRVTFAEADIKVANLSENFVSYYQAYVVAGEKVSSQVNVGTVIRSMSDDWLAAFHYWGGVNLRTFLSAVALQGQGQGGELLTNGKLNGCVLSEDNQYATTFRWHDPARSFPEQTATFPDLGWSFHVVHVGGRHWCPQGGRIIYV